MTTFYKYLFMNHLEAEDMTPGICGMKGKLPKNGNANGPDKIPEAIVYVDKKAYFCSIIYLVGSFAAS